MPSPTENKAQDNNVSAGGHATPGSLASAKPTLTLMGFFALTAAMVLSVHEYPTFAVAGMQIPFFLLLCGFLWFLPVALCSAEMATVEGWEDGGIFSWVSGMLGEGAGFVAIFFQWFQITVCFVTTLYFMLSAIANILNWPALNNNPLVKFIAVTVLFWAITLAQLGGTDRTAHIAKYSWFIGVVAPTVLLVVLGAFYLASGHPLQFDASAKNLLPDFAKASTLVVFVSFLFANMGAEASASHINEMKNPRRDYPLAMLLLVALATVLNAVGGFAVAGAVPLKELSLSGGMVQTFSLLLQSVSPHLGWAVKVICAMLVFGVVGEVGSWVVGPARGLYAASQRGLLPKRLQRLNKNDVPVRLVIGQGIVVTIWAAVLTFGGGAGNLSYLTALSLTTVIYLVSYLLLFVAYLRLARKPQIKRDYHVPGGKIGKYLFAGSGLATSLFALVIAFFPPAILQGADIARYEVLLAISFALTLAMPVLLYLFYGKKHSTPQQKPSHLLWREVSRFTRLTGRGEHRIRSGK